MVRVVVGCPVRDRAWVLPRWFDAVRNQELPDGVVLETAFLLSPSEDETRDIIVREADYVAFDGENGRTIHESEGHFWGGATYDFMARIRNQLIDMVAATGADYFFSLDSDVLIPPDGLGRLLAFSASHPGVVAPALNLAQQGLAWNTMNWSVPGQPGKGDRPAVTKLQDGPADVIMAALLIDRPSMAVRFQGHPQGEDLGYCVDAHQRGVSRWWMPSVHCDHLMRRC